MTTDNAAVMPDLDRQKRCGFPEVIYGEGKSFEQVVAITDRLLDDGQAVLITRVSSQLADALQNKYRQEGKSKNHYNSVGHTYTITLEDHRQNSTDSSKCGYVPIIGAGTTDLPVVEEAFETLCWMQIKSQKIMDVGVAGPHRFPEKLELIEGANAVVVVAGMEGALPSVVAGYVNCPVIAVPTSVGYGANLGGVAALLSMLNSCAANVTVVNIDAGFKGAYVAGMIASGSRQTSK